MHCFNSNKYIVIDSRPSIFFPLSNIQNQEDSTKKIKWIPHHIEAFLNYVYLLWCCIFIVRLILWLCITRMVYLFWVVSIFPVVVTFEFHRGRYSFERKNIVYKASFDLWDYKMYRKLANIRDKRFRVDFSTKNTISI